LYIELHSRSAFSFLEGSSLPESLIARCAELQMPAMALIDRDGVYGAPRFHMAAKKAGVKAHIGAEVNCVFALQKPPCGDSRPRLSSGRRPDFLYSASMSSFARPNRRGRLSPQVFQEARGFKL